MSITAKVVVHDKTLHIGGSATVRIGADYAGNRNAEWAQATPTLALTMTLNPAAAGLFEPGDRFTLTFDKEVTSDDPSAGTALGADDVD